MALTKKRPIKGSDGVKERENKGSIREWRSENER